MSESISDHRRISAVLRYQSRAPLGFDNKSRAVCKKTKTKIRINSACAHVVHRRSQSLNLLLITLFIISVYFGVNSKLFMKNGKIVEKEAVYRDRLKGLQILLSNSQAGTGRKVKQEQEEISRNHVQAF